ncbi:MAG: prepilin-type N-terminal cleavage/methylation domain-containing protein [Planctomycetes bacterium]|nr:prepilin-type N-terminal cleavage/methylation domain-containing protein [Planctomycetota bacterium]
MTSVTSRSRSTACAGFSLLELILALALITGLATVSIWAYFARGEVTLENAARLLVDDLHVAQSRAMFLRAPVEVRFDADGLGYRVCDATGRTQSGIAELDFSGRRYDADAVFEGVCIQGLRGADERFVRFDAKGVAAQAAWITLGYRGEARTVQVDVVAGVALVVDAGRR